jgi:ATP-dependent Clp protease adaptor protein ClpS
MTAHAQSESTTAVKMPNLWTVRIMNDDFTPMDFVIDLLREVFNKPEDEAMVITQAVHEAGSSIIGVYPRDIAVSKTQRAMTKCENEGHPLQVVPEVMG